MELLESQASKKKGIKQSNPKEDSWIKSRESLQSFLIFLLLCEIIFTFYLVLSQGIGKLLFTNIRFEITQWIFGTFINGIVIQTFFLIKPIVKNLFPGGKGAKGY